MATNHASIDRIQETDLCLQETAPDPLKCNCNSDLNMHLHTHIAGLGLSNRDRALDETGILKFVLIGWIVDTGICSGSLMPQEAAHATS